MEGGLKATGVAIRPDKPFIYPLDFKFSTTGKCDFKPLDDIHQEITVKDEHKTRQVLEKVAATVGNETLGVYLAPDSNCNNTVKELKDNAITWKHHLTAGNLSPKEAW